MENEKRLIDAKGKFVLNAGDLTGHIMCIENGYATVFDRFAKVICKFSLLDAPTVDAVEVVRCKDCQKWFRHTQVDRERGDCRRYQTTKHENGYCDRGERKSDG